MPSESLNTYVNPTGDGYVTVRHVRDNRTVEVPVDELDAEAGEIAYATVAADMATVVLQADQPKAYLEGHLVSGSEDGPRHVTIGSAVCRHLGVDAGDAIRVYEHEHGLALVNADADPRVGGEDDG